MVDIHSHILPGWDDGSKSLAESLDMLRIAADSGTTDIVATPHANTEFPFNPETVQILYQELKQAATGIPIQIHLGCDFHVRFDYVQSALANPAMYTVNHGPYLMVELPDTMHLPVIREIMDRFRNAGIVPVITHPERNLQLQTQAAELRRWVEDGTLLQVTGQSLLGRFGAGALQCGNQLLKQDLVHFVASDAHDTRDRTPRLTEAYEFVRSQYGEERAERLFSLNPEAVVHGGPISYPSAEAVPAGPQKKWWAFWKG